MAAMAAFTFSSCEDVPAPYNSPSQPENSDTPDTSAGEAKGTGTATDPFNCAGAVAYCKSLESGVESTKDVYVKGKIKSIEEAFNANYGNCSVTLKTKAPAQPLRFGVPTTSTTRNGRLAARS